VKSPTNKPIGDITRGTTHPNRLRRSDRWILHSVCPEIRAALEPLVVDLGYGRNPVTTLELFHRLRQHVRLDVEVVGIEIDPERVADAVDLSQAGLTFVRGGFEIPMPDGRQPVLIRAFNVLRQYDEADVQDAWQTMTNRLESGGYLVEGTSDEVGRLSSWVSLRAGSSTPETFSLSLQVNSINLPSDIAPRLPKCLIHRNVPGENIYNFLKQCDAAWVSHANLSPFGARQRWIATVETLVSQGIQVHDSKQRWRLGEITVPWTVVQPTK